MTRQSCGTFKCWRKRFWMPNSQRSWETVSSFNEIKSLHARSQCLIYAAGSTGEVRSSHAGQRDEAESWSAAAENKFAEPRKRGSAERVESREMGVQSCAERNGQGRADQNPAARNAQKTKENRPKESLFAFAARTEEGETGGPKIETPRLNRGALFYGREFTTLSNYLSRTFFTR